MYTVYRCVPVLTDPPTSVAVMPHGIYPFETMYSHSNTGHPPAMLELLHHPPYTYPCAQQQVVLNSSSTMPINAPAQEQPYGTNVPVSAEYYGKQLSNESRGSTERSTSVEEKESLQKHVTRRAALKLSTHVKSWERLGLFLNLDEVELKHICADYEAEGTRECIYQVILRWMKTNDSEPTFEKLEEALLKAKENIALQFLWDNLENLTLQDN